MIDINYHTKDLSKLSFLITGGAGFIGSNIVSYLIKHNAGRVVVLDNFSNGYIRNIEKFIGKPNFELIEGDITDSDTCKKAMKGIDYVSHQAALGSVPRSIENPLATHQANTTGFINILLAAKENNIKRVIFASSSSVYGDSQYSPKKEDVIGNQLSPYAVSKRAKELYASVFALNYGLDVVGLRYFNVFGPNQSPNGPYAAVIPLFINAVMNNKSPYINGDGEQCRDFTYVDNVVQANIKAFFSDKEVKGKIINIAFGKKNTINDLFSKIRAISNCTIEPIYREPRKGDVKNSLADITLAKELLGYEPSISVDVGLKQTMDWFQINK